MIVIVVVVMVVWVLFLLLPISNNVDSDGVRGTYEKENDKPTAHIRIRREETVRRLLGMDGCMNRTMIR